MAACALAPPPQVVREGLSPHPAALAAAVCTAAGPRMEDCTNMVTIRSGRYSTIHVGHCAAVGGLVAVKVYGTGGGESAAAGQGPAATKAGKTAAAAGEGPPGATVAVQKRSRRLATREAVVLQYLNTCGVPNVPALYSAYSTGPQFHLVQQYCGGGDLLAALQRRRGQGFPERVVAEQFAGPLLRTLAAIHAAGVVHRDVKLENIFADDAGHPYLGDFDLAVFSYDPPARSPVGTVPYMAPELLVSSRDAPLDPASAARLGPPLDVWSLGVCLFELTAGYKPFQGVSYQGVAAAVLAGAREPLPRGTSPAFGAFIDAALTPDPAARATAAELLLHPWVAGGSNGCGDGAGGDSGGTGGAAAAGAAAAGRGRRARGGGADGGPRSDSAGSMEELRQARARSTKAAVGPGSPPSPPIASVVASAAPAHPTAARAPPPPLTLGRLAAAKAAAAAVFAAAAGGANPRGVTTGSGGSTMETLLGDTQEDQLSANSSVGAAPSGPLLLGGAGAGGGILPPAAAAAHGSSRFAPATARAAAPAAAPLHFAEAGPAPQMAGPMAPQPRAPSPPQLGQPVSASGAGGAEQRASRPPSAAGASDRRRSSPFEGAEVQQEVISLLTDPAAAPAGTDGRKTPRGSKKGITPAGTQQGTAVTAPAADAGRGSASPSAAARGLLGWLLPCLAPRALV